ncbi:MAG: hypothetical protein ACKO2P_02820, partial [Planctomycetota bacterium]
MKMPPFWNPFRFGLALALLCAFPAPAALPSAEQIEIHCTRDELIIQLPRFDLLRRTSPALTAELQVRCSDGREQRLVMDLSDPAVSGTLVVNLANCGAPVQAGIVVRRADGTVILERPFAAVRQVAIRSQLFPATDGRLAAIQPGSGPASEEILPRILLPDVSRLRAVQIAAATRSLTKDSITYPVVAQADAPLRCASILVGRQTAAPQDPHAASLYVTYKKAIFVGDQLDRWLKFLVEVPLHESWGHGQGDETIRPGHEIKVHVTDQVREKDWSGRQRHILGEGQEDLGQTHSATDDDGRLYFIADGRVVRFDPNVKAFECSPPLRLQKLCPGGETMKGSPGWLTGNLLMVCTRGRIFLIDILDYMTAPNPPGIDVPQRRIGGVFSIPQDWSNPEEFAADTRLHAGTWENATPTLYTSPPTVGAAADERKLGLPVITETGLLIVPAGKKAAGGPWRLDLDAQGRNIAFGEVRSLDDLISTDGQTTFQRTREATIRGVPKTMVHLAGNIFGRHLVGPAGLDGFEIPRASIRQLLMSDGWDASMLLPPTSRHAYRTYTGAPAGTVTVKYDIVELLNATHQAQGPLRESLKEGPGLGPVFLVSPIPGLPAQAVAVSDYAGYPLCQLDFSSLEEKRTVFKTHLPEKTPLATGLGPYDSTWVLQGDELWLIVTGYTGMTRIRYAKSGQRARNMTSDVFHTRMVPTAIDGQVRGGLKQYDRILPVIGGRLLDSGTGRPGRGGTPFTTGVELFSLSDLPGTGPVPSQTAASLSRCCGALKSLQSRVSWNLSDGRLRQEIFGSGRPSQVGLAELDEKDKSLVPTNHDEKIFLYEVLENRGLRDLFALALPLSASGQTVDSYLALSPCHQFLVILTDDATLWSWNIAQRQFIDGIRLQ